MADHRDKICSAAMVVRMDHIHRRKVTRPVIQDHVKELVKSIAEVGLLSPIIVRSLPDMGESVFELLAGNHRYEACLELKMPTISAIAVEAGDLQAELIEIDENLCQERLTAAQEAAAITRRKQIYEKLHPETRHGGSRRSSRQNGVMKSIQKSMLRFSGATAAATGRSERAIQRVSRRGEKIDPAALESVVGTSLDNGAELDALSTLSVAEQRALAERAAQGERISARSPSSGGIAISSSQWRSKFGRLMEEAPTPEDREWAATTARRLADTSFPELPPSLDRRTSKA